jgi:hypothetical protein
MSGCSLPLHYTIRESYLIVCWKLEIGKSPNCTSPACHRPGIEPVERQHRMRKLQPSMCRSARGAEEEEDVWCSRSGRMDVDDDDAERDVQKYVHTLLAQPTRVVVDQDLVVVRSDLREAGIALCPRGRTRDSVVLGVAQRANWRWYTVGLCTRQRGRGRTLDVRWGRSSKDET